MLIAFAPFDWYDSLVAFVADSDWTYLLVAGFVLLDADVPLLPGETIILTTAIAASEGELVVWLVMLAATVGGVLGDNVSYWIGRRFGRDVYFRFFGGERERKRYDWAQRVLREHGAWIIPAVRFVPFGRTAITLASGGLHMAWRDFLAADVAGVIVWAALYTALGYFGGETFSEENWAAFAVSLAVAGVIMGVGYGWYKLEARGSAGS